MYLEFSLLRFVLVLALTLLSMKWISNRDAITKLYFVPFFVFFFIYSGVGYGWDDTKPIYIIYYAIYIATFSYTCCRLSIKRKECSQTKDNTISTLIQRHGRNIILSYLFVCILELGLAGKISNLWSPPSMTEDFSSFDWDGGHGGAFSAILYYVKEVLFIFYVLSLNKYKNNQKLLLFNILFPFYITYVTNAYLARGAVMAFLLIVAVNYLIYHPQNRKRLLIIGSFALPLILYLLAVYTYVRQGVEFDESFGFALKLLLFQETNYPLHLNQVLKNGFDQNLFETYLEWIVTLPLPGFLSPFNSDYAFTARFSEMISGISRTTSGFNIFLPGIVGEGVYILGPFLYPLHALLLAFLVSTVFRVLNNRNERFLLMYYGIYAAFVIGRGGTVSLYPFYFKHFILYIIILNLLSKKNVK